MSQRLLHRSYINFTTLQNALAAPCYNACARQITGNIDRGHNQFGIRSIYRPSDIVVSRVLVQTGASSQYPWTSRAVICLW